MEIYLKPTPVIDCDALPVRGKAQDLAGGKENDVEKAKALFYFVRDEIKYNPYVPHNLAEQHKASATLNADLPLEEMLKACVKVYGPDYLKMSERLLNLGLE